MPTMFGVYTEATHFLRSTDLMQYHHGQQILTARHQESFVVHF